MLLELKNINKYYVSGEISLHALKDVSFTVKEGEFLAIMGSSGSGKSTLMNILGCLDNQFSGVYLLNGIDISKASENELSQIRNRRVGFVFQAFNLLPKLSALANVELPLMYAGVAKHKRKEIAMNLLKKVGLEDRVHHRPNELSGGQKQRVAIARALVNNPSIILADEPTGNLDSKSEKEIISILKELNKEGKTIIIVTHEESIGNNADRKIVFKDGEMI